MYIKKRLSILRIRLTTSSFLGLLSSFAFGAITPDLVVSRVSGPAPLAVHFDASGTKTDDPSVNTFGDLGYRFNFGDPASGTWAYSGKPKNEQIGGPIAAHVYATPGTYTATVDVGSIDGQRESKSIQITVLSPGDVYAGTKTVCIAMTSADSGCPTGAIKRLAPTSWGTFASGTRYLLAASQDFTLLGNLSVSCSDCMVSAYGDGAKPIVKKITYAPRPALPPARNAVIQNLGIGSLSVQFGENFLASGNDISSKDNTTAVVFVGDTVTYYFKNPGSFDPTKIAWPKNIFISENKLDGLLIASGGIYALANQIAIMGNLVQNPKTHDIRIPMGHKAFVAHNQLNNLPTATFHQIKFHAQGIQPWVSDFVFDAVTPASSMSVVSSNIIGDGLGDINYWQISVGPQNAQSIEGHQNTIVEDNEFIQNSAAPNSQQQIVITGTQVYERGNRFKNIPQKIDVGTVGESALNPPEWKSPVFTGGKSVSDWLGAGQSSPPAAVNLQVQ